MPRASRKHGAVPMPLAPRVARAIDLAIGRRSSGPIFVGITYLGGGHGHAAVAGAAQHDVAKVREVQHGLHVLHVGVESDPFLAAEVSALAHAGERA
jgi:hypothetical protein